MSEIDAVKVLECMAIDMVGALAGLSKKEPLADVLCQRIEAINLAQSALREKAERNKGCGFCCYQEHPDKTFYPKEGYAFYAGFSKQIDVDAFDEIETDEIKYCPMCGKRLEVEP